MNDTTMMMYGALVGSALGLLVMLGAMLVMLKRRAKERREKAEQRAHGLHA